MDAELNHATVTGWAAGLDALHADRAPLRARGTTPGVRRPTRSGEPGGAVRWPQPAVGMSCGNRSATDVSNRLLTVPADQRYGSGDIQRVTGSLGLPTSPVTIDCAQTELSR
jgi:hypothetical protein